MINIDLRLLKLKNLTPGEYCILKCLNDKEYDLLTESFLTSAPIISLEDFESLESKGYIKLSSDTMNLKKINFRQNARDLFEESSIDKKFLELFSKYPVKVPDGQGGYRILKASRSDSKDSQTAKVAYDKILKKDPLAHEKMIKGLEKQLDTTRGKLQYMQQFNVWLNQRTYEKYYDLEEESGEDAYRERL